MGASHSDTWEPFSASCATQRFHCLGRMHPLILTIPNRHDSDIVDMKILLRLVEEERVIIELDSFRNLSVHLHSIFNDCIPKLTELRELAIAPVGGEFTRDRPLSTEWMTPAFGRSSPFTTYGWDRDASSKLQQLQLAVPLSPAILGVLIGQVAVRAPHLEVLELDRCGASPLAPLRPH